MFILLSNGIQNNKVDTGQHAVILGNHGAIYLGAPSWEGYHCTSHNAEHLHGDEHCHPQHWERQHEAFAFAILSDKTSN